MSMITGIGDEVVWVMLGLAAAGVTVLAWWSTAARPGRFQTVILMERTSRTSAHQLTLMGRNINNIRRHLLRNATASPVSVPPIQASTTDWQEEAEGSESEGSGSEGAGVVGGAGAEQVAEMDSIVDAMDAGSALRCRGNRTINRHAGDTNTSSTSEVSNDKGSPHGDVQTPHDTQTENAPQTNSKQASDTGKSETETVGEENSPEIGDNAQKINIKLKYLNDTFREVDGNPDELLKHFKWRHFSSELSRQMRVLLIFNGHVLSDEASSLQACGLYNNCVVHCLVQTPRQPRVAPTVEAAPTPAGTAPEPRAAPAPERAAWDMENILMTLVSIILTIIWFFRCEYSNLFTASASGALFALTVFYSIAIFGLYFSDTFNLSDRRNRENEQAQRQPQPAGS